MCSSALSDVASPPSLQSNQSTTTATLAPDTVPSSPCTMSFSVACRRRRLTMCGVTTKRPLKDVHHFISIILQPSDFRHSSINLSHWTSVSGWPIEVLLTAQTVLNDPAKLNEMDAGRRNGSGRMNRGSMALSRYRFFLSSCSFNFLLLFQLQRGVSLNSMIPETYFNSGKFKGSSVAPRSWWVAWVVCTCWGRLSGMETWRPFIRLPAPNKDM